MALIPEFGEGDDPDANSYVTLEEFKAYFDNREFDYSLYSPDAKMGRALIAATQYVDVVYGCQFRGRRLLTTQPLAFPRQCLYLYGALAEGVPTLLKGAVCEYAKILLEGPGSLLPNPVYDATGAIITEKSVRIGPIEKTVKLEFGTAASLKAFPLPRYMLGPLLYPTDGVIRN